MGLAALALGGEIVALRHLMLQAADTERAGSSVDVERLRAIESLQNEIAAIERDIAERDKEIEALSDSFKADVERFGMLQDVVKLRQTLRPRSNKPAKKL